MIKLEKLFSTLNKGKVRYLIAGGIAVNLYGIADVFYLKKVEKEWNDED